MSETTDQRGAADPEATADRLVTDLREARTALADAEAAVEEYGESTLRSVAAAHREATGLLDRYEDRATGTGDFGAYVEFQDAFVELVEGLDDDLPRREAFERANDHVDKRRLDEDDFDRAREELQVAAELAARLEARASARDRLEQAKSAAEKRHHEFGERIDRLERLRRLGEADLDAPVERLRDPVESYDEAVAAAWEAFLAEASAREAFEVVAATENYPLVDFRQPPPELREYVETKPAGTESIPTLLEYADYSTSKLDHYVDDPAALQTRVAVHRTYLERLDAGPLSVSWPPPSAATLRYRASELVSVVARFADDEVVAAARDLRNLPDEVEYERLREAALARDELDERERERLASGAVETELAAVRRARERLEAALDGD
ncbi:MAG: hypothetical protein ABEJ82_06595 [Haloplanus sp.]